MRLGHDFFRRLAIEEYDHIVVEKHINFSWKACRKSFPMIFNLSAHKGNILFEIDENEKQKLKGLEKLA